MRKTFPVILLLGICSLFSLLGYGADRDAKWFHDAKYGIFTHYLGAGPDWNDQVNKFDVEFFANQIKRAQAKYLIFTLGQNSGYYCSPNAVYEKYAGYQTGERCSKRDLPMEIADALAKRGIRLMLYLPSRAPQQDKQAMQGLGDVNENEPAPQEFTKRWSEVIAEWSNRYGRKISGWWFDGSYNTKGWDDLSKPYNWNTWASACRSGNPDSLIAFNRGADIKKAFIRLSEQQDYTAGEQNQFEATPSTNSAPKGMQWHILSYLGSSWARADGPTNRDDYMIGYVKSVIAEGGVVTIDVNVSGDGHIYFQHLAQLIQIGQAFRQ